LVKKSTIAALAGIGILAAVFLGRPKVVKTVPEPIPFEVPRPVPQPVPIPFLNVDVAKDFLTGVYGNLFRQSGTVQQLTSSSRSALEREVAEFNKKYRTYANTGRRNPSQVGVGWAINYADKYGWSNLIEYETVPQFEKI
jgi:hypothetical protein